MAISATKSVLQQESGAHRNGQGDPQAKRINPAIQKHKSISDSEQEGMKMMGKGKNEAKLTPLAGVGSGMAWRIAA
jgi:hypothetical protein